MAKPIFTNYLSEHLETLELEELIAFEDHVRPLEDKDHPRRAFWAAIYCQVAQMREWKRIVRAGEEVIAARIADTGGPVN